MGPLAILSLTSPQATRCPPRAVDLFLPPSTANETTRKLAAWRARHRPVHCSFSASASLLVCSLPPESCWCSGTQIPQCEEPPQRA